MSHYPGPAQTGLLFRHACGASGQDAKSLAIGAAGVPKSLRMDARKRYELGLMQ